MQLSSSNLMMKFEWMLWVMPKRCTASNASQQQPQQLHHEWDEEYPNKVEMKRLQELAKRISTVPEAVEMQSRVAKIYGDRQAMAAGEKLFDWGGAENLAYATLVHEGIPGSPVG